MRSVQKGLMVTGAGIAANVVLAMIKIVTGILGNSYALIADGIESTTDIVSSLVVWTGLKISSIPADEDHPYGHGKAEPLAAAVVATMLLLAAAWIAVTSSIELLQPHKSPAPFTLLVLIAVVVIKESLFRHVVREGVSLDSCAVKTDAWHHRSDAITSIAAGLGITVALIGGPAWSRADDVAAVFAAGIIAWNGWRLLRATMGELMDASPDPALAGRVRDLAGQVEKVARIEKCRIRKMGGQYFVDLHVEVASEMPVREAHGVAHAVKDRVCAEVPSVADVLVHIEPAAAAVVSGSQ
jgi:cation diffusion facilitator family transporter